MRRIPWNQVAELLFDDFLSILDVDAADVECYPVPALVETDVLHCALGTDESQRLVGWHANSVVGLKLDSLFWD